MKLLARHLLSSVGLEGEGFYDRLNQTNQVAVGSIKGLLHDAISR